MHGDAYRGMNTANSIRIENKLIGLPKIGEVPIVLHRPLKSAIKTVDVLFKQGHWYVSIVQKVDVQEPIQSLERIIGIDINSQATVVDSDGRTYANPKFLNESKEKLKRLQRAYARKKRGSVRSLKCRNKLTALHGKIQRQRKDFAHQLSAAIAKHSDVVIAEDLNVKGMQKFNGSMVQDNVMGSITSLLKYKMHKKGGLYHEIGRYEKSTGVCRSCQTQHSLTLKERHFTCTACGEHQDRDHSAALHVRRLGIAGLLAAGTAAKGSGPALKKNR